MEAGGWERDCDCECVRVYTTVALILHKPTTPLRFSFLCARCLGGGWLGGMGCGGGGIVTKASAKIGLATGLSKRMDACEKV
jgi:hypothetical protein